MLDASSTLAITNSLELACTLNPDPPAGVCDYRVLGNRSRSYLALDKLDEACQDAELACRLHPFWAKVQTKTIAQSHFSGSLHRGGGSL